VVLEQVVLALQALKNCNIVRGVRDKVGQNVLTCTDAQSTSALLVQSLDYYESELLLSLHMHALHYKLQHAV
jgi:predicted secreted Zn-dependent protease